MSNELLLPNTGNLAGWNREERLLRGNQIDWAVRVVDGVGAAEAA